MIASTVQVSDCELVCKAQHGDREAFGEIVQRNRTGMINMVYRMCGDACLAEDAAQTAFINAWQHLASYKPTSSLRSWLYRIAINAALDMLRKEKPTSDPGPADLSSPGNPLEALVEKNEMCKVVQKAIQVLPPASRAVLVLREYEGMSYQEIAQVLDIPQGTVMSRLNYARTRLLDVLKPYMMEAL